MKIGKKRSLLLFILLISLLLVSFKMKGEEMSEMNTFSNAYYTVQYPLNWIQAEYYLGDRLIVFLTEDNQISLKIHATNIFPEASEGYLLTQIEKSSMEFEEYIIDKKTGYKVEIEEGDKIYACYLVQKEDLVFEMNFEYQADDYNYCESLIEQIVNSFEFNDFESFRVSIDNWNIYRIENLEIYYPDNSEIYENIEEWAKVRSEAFDYITEYLDVQWKYEPIKMYVFNSKEHGEQYGFILGFAKPKHNLILTQYVQSPGHELAHCISYWINNGERIDSALINEGLATYLNMLRKDYHRLAADILQEKNYSIKLFRDDFRKNKQKDAYTLGASFVKYLIDEYSLELFKEFFAQIKYNEEESFREFYDKEGNMLINEWMEYLKTY